MMARFPPRGITGRGESFWKTVPSSTPPRALLAGVIFEKYILVFQIQIFGSKYKIQEGLKPDRNNAREGRIVGRDAMRRALGAASALLTRRYHAARRPRGGPIGYSADRAGGAIPADVCAHTVAHRSWCPDTWPLSPPDEDQNTCDRRLPLVWRRCMHAATDTVVRRPHGSLPADRLARLDHLAAVPADVWPRRLQGTQRPNYAARTHETRHSAF